MQKQQQKIFVLIFETYVVHLPYKPVKQTKDNQETIIFNRKALYHRTLQGFDVGVLSHCSIAGEKFLRHGTKMSHLENIQCF